MVNKDLGMVTAYAYAVSKGYTGTEEEFAALMADYAAVGQRAEAAATAAAASATAASGSASDSAASATAAEGFAGNASASAGNASQAAQNASQSATAASGSATSAAQSATQAAGSATTASTKATEAAQSATAAAGSATTAGASATAAQAAQTAAETAQTAAETAQGAAEDAAESVSASAAQIAQNTADISLVKSHLNAVEIVDTASGAIATFADGSDGVPVESLTVSLEPIQSGTGDPSPDNVRPISGRQSVTVTRSGVNVWDEEWESGYINNITGEFVASQNYICTKNFISIVPGKSYYIKTPVALKLTAYDANKTFLRSIVATWANEVIGGSAHLSDVYYIKFYNAASGALTTYNHDISINYPSTDHDYHPGTVASVEVQLGQTVYGGTVDVVSGEMVVDRAIVDMGTLTWSSPATNIFRTNDLASTIKQGTSPYAKLICSQYKTVQASNWASGTNDVITSHPSYSNGNVLVKDTAYTDAASFKTAMNGVQLCYELAEPITVQLTPEQLTTVLGQNNVWSDADSVSVDYVADTKLFIEQLTEPDADMIADANITSGSYFMVGNQLFLATSNIANGAAVVPGTNCTRTNLAAALNAINA